MRAPLAERLGYPPLRSLQPLKMQRTQVELVDEGPLPDRRIPFRGWPPKLSDVRGKGLLPADPSDQRIAKEKNMQTTRSPLGTTARTGQKCPESGVWQVAGSTPSTTAPIAKGNTMPPYANRAVTWKLTQYA